MTFESCSFVNDIEQVIEPGDQVVFITTRSGRARIRKGRFLGTTEGDIDGPRVKIETSAEYSWSRPYSILYYNRVYKESTPLAVLLGKLTSFSL